jgi:hypothetical protein
MRAWRVGVAAAVLLTACGTDAAAPSDSALPAVDTSSTAGATVADGASGADPVFRDTVFLTAVDRILAGTSYEGLVDVDPEAFTETAATLCERLDGGADPDDLLSEYLVALGEARTPVSDDDAYLAGALLGAGVEVYCPEHADRLPSE